MESIDFSIPAASTVIAVGMMKENGIDYERSRTWREIGYTVALLAAGFLMFLFTVGEVK